MTVRTQGHKGAAISCGSRPWRCRLRAAPRGMLAHADFWFHRTRRRANSENSWIHWDRSVFNNFPVPFVVGITRVRLTEFAELYHNFLWHSLYRHLNIEIQFLVRCGISKIPNFIVIGSANISCIYWVGKGLYVLRISAIIKRRVFMKNKKSKGFFSRIPFSRKFLLVQLGIISSTLIFLMFVASDLFTYVSISIFQTY